MQEDKNEVPPLTGRRPLLRRHLGIVLVVKVLLLIGLWQAFVKPYRVKVDSDNAAAHIATPSKQINQGE